MQAFQNITSMPQHQAFSPEELRLNDYAHRRGNCNPYVSTPSAFTPTTPFSLPREPGLLPATLATNPFAANRPQDSCRADQEQMPLVLGPEIVFFDVGKTQPKRFAVHESVITPHSEFVRMALSHDWKEATERTIPLPDDEPEVFALYQQWLYTRRISFSHATSSPQHAQLTYPLLVKSYILGEKLLDPAFQDAIIDSIIAKLLASALFDITLTNLVYDHIPPPRR